MGLLEVYRQQVGERQVEYRAAKHRLRAEEEALEASTRQVKDVEAAQALVQAVVQHVQQQVHQRIASVVCRALEAVFDDPYEFRIRFEQKRGRTEACLIFARGGMEIDPLTASGGGPVDVASFALRLSCLLLHRPPLARVIVLDEPFKFVSAEYRDRLRELLVALSEEMKVQIIMVTHIPELQVGQVVRL